MKKIVNLKCEIWSPSGQLVKLNDTLIVKLPHNDLSDSDGEGYWVSRRTIKAKLGLQLSRGLILRVIEIIDGEDDKDFSTLKVGSIISFKRVAWDWDLDI